MSEYHNLLRSMRALDARYLRLRIRAQEQGRMDAYQARLDEMRERYEEMARLLGVIEANGPIFY